MRQLTKHQKDFILEAFFKPLLNDFAGAMNIGEVLLTEGGCVVPDSGSYIFRQSVPLGQFNTIKRADNKKYVGCLEYEFDLDGFLESFYLKRAVAKHYDNLKDNYEKQTQIKNELFQLLGQEISVSIEDLRINQLVYHKQIYNGHEQMKIVGLRENEVELEGDWSGGTHGVCQKDWMPIEGVLLTKND